MNLSTDRLIEFYVSENDKGNFNFYSIKSDEQSAEVILMVVLLRVVGLGFTPDLLSLLKNPVQITGTLSAFPESIHPFNLMLLIDKVIQFVEDVW